MKLPILASLAFVVMVTADARAAGLTVGVAERLAAVPNGPGAAGPGRGAAAETRRLRTERWPGRTCSLSSTTPGRPLSGGCGCSISARGRVLFHELVAIL